MISKESTRQQFDISLLLCRLRELETRMETRLRDQAQTTAARFLGLEQRIDALANGHLGIH